MKMCECCLNDYHEGIYDFLEQLKYSKKYISLYEYLKKQSWCPNCMTQYINRYMTDQTFKEKRNKQYRKKRGK